jgi:hypothetical protein
MVITESQRTNLETAPGTIRFVSPFHIHDAYLIKQDRKHGID